MPIDITSLAQEIFVSWATQIGPLNWQWDEMAQAAFNAATRFAYVASIQSSTPDQPSVTAAATGGSN